jgi:hypothetical protein
MPSLNETGYAAFPRSDKRCLNARALTTTTNMSHSVMTFKLATASTLGSTHQKLSYNNQDACDCYEDENIRIGVVADGCGSSPHSEVGAKLGVHFVVNFCRLHFSNEPFDAEKLGSALVEFLTNVVRNQQAADEPQFIESYLYFTLFGFIVQASRTYIFHSGDGVYCLNDKEVVVAQDNRPNYIARDLTGNQAKFEVDSIETSNLQQLMVATDGLMHLTEKFLNSESVEGMQSLGDLFDNESYFDEEVASPKFLTHLAMNLNILKDDTSMILLTRA